MWSLQVHALLDGYDLAGHLDGSTAALLPIQTNGETTSPNPEFQIWKRQDRLIYSALIGAISPALQPLVARTSNSHEIWSTLASTYARPSRGHQQQPQTQLKHWKKENKTIDLYIQGLITRFDQLSILGKSIDHEDQIDYVLDGLPEEYKTVIDQIQGRDTSPTIAEIHERLLNYEAKLMYSAASVPSTFPVTANMAQQQRFSTANNRQQFQKRYNNSNPTGQQQQHPPRWQQAQSVTRSDGRPFKPYLGKCQFCGEQGYSARRCPQIQTLQSTSTPVTSSPFRPWQPRANHVSNTPYSVDNWLVDSGATHHITSDLHNLSFHL